MKVNVKGVVAGVRDSMRDARGSVHHRTGTDWRGLAVAEDLARTGVDDHHFFLNVPVGRVRGLVRIDHEPAGHEVLASGHLTRQIDADLTDFDVQPIPRARVLGMIVDYRTRFTPEAVMKFDTIRPHFC